MTPPFLLALPRQVNLKIKGCTLCCLTHLLACLNRVASGLPHQRIIGAAIRKHRNAVGLSQEKLAEKAELHPVYLGQVERGEQAVSVHALVRLAKALKVHVRDLVADI